MIVITLINLNTENKKEAEDIENEEIMKIYILYKYMRKNKEFKIKYQVQETNY